MLKTCFSSRKGYHLIDNSIDYDVASGTVIESTIGFDQLQWSNDFNHLLPFAPPPELTSDDDNEEEEETGEVEEVLEEEEGRSPSHSPIKKLSKLERKAMRKAKRENRKLHGSRTSIKKRNLRSNTLETNLQFKDFVEKIENGPESFELHNTTIYKDDIYTLKDQEWLNDTIITYAFNLLEIYQLKPFYQKFNLSHSTICLLPPALCYLILSSSDTPESLVSMLPEKFHDCRVLILPMNDGGSHWSLSVISILDRVFYTFDSLTDTNSTENDQACSNFAKLIGAASQQPKYKLTKQRLPSPQQVNDYDCGVFTIAFACFIVSELIGSQLGSPAGARSWRLNFNLNSKIQNVNCMALRTFLLRSILENNNTTTTQKLETPKI